jgi:hypothetical protein
MSMRVALATCLKPPEHDPDQDALLEALRSLGVDAEMAAWDDPAVEYRRFDACVIRSTWDYIHRHAAFLEWTRRVSSETRLLNPADVVAWNSDKRYLGELEARGVPTVPTAYVGRGERGDLERLARDRGWGEVVIKPRVGAGSFATRRFPAASRAEAARFLESLAAERDAMVQPFLASVEGSGERALVWIAGELTHAVRKGSRWHGEHESVSGALSVAGDERALALRALEPLAERLLYARVDVARDGAGAPRLMELELIEPSLFLRQEPRALRRFAEAIAAAARR